MQDPLSTGAAKRTSPRTTAPAVGGTALSPGAFRRCTPTRLEHVLERQDAKHLSHGRVRGAGCAWPHDDGRRWRRLAARRGGDLRRVRGARRKLRQQARPRTGLRGRADALSRARARQATGACLVGALRRPVLTVEEQQCIPTVDDSHVAAPRLEKIESMVQRGVS